MSGSDGAHDGEEVTVHVVRTMKGTVAWKGRSGRYWFTANDRSATMFVDETEILRDAGALGVDDQVLYEGAPAIVVEVAEAGRIRIETAGGTVWVDAEQLKRPGS